MTLYTHKQRNMKVLLWSLLFLISISPTLGLEDCSDLLEPSDIPCRVTSTWNYTVPCSSHTAVIYNTTGEQVISYTFTDFGDTQLCNFTFNITGTGTYNFIVDNGDTGLIIVEDDIVKFAIGGGFLLIILIVLWMSFLLMTFLVKGERGKTINFFNMMQMFCGFAVGVTLIPYTIVIGFSTVFMSIGIFVGLNAYERL